MLSLESQPDLRKRMGLKRLENGNCFFTALLGWLRFHADKGFPIKKGGTVFSRSSSVMRAFLFFCSAHSCAAATLAVTLFLPDTSIEKIERTAEKQRQKYDIPESHINLPTPVIPPPDTRWPPHSRPESSGRRMLSRTISRCRIPGAWRLLQSRTACRAGRIP